MSVQEVVVCTTASPTAQSSGCVAFHNITTGALLASFKQTNAVKNCTAVVDTLDNQGGFLLASQPEKAVLNMYSFQKDQIALKIVLPEKLTCIAVDNQGLFCAGGTVHGRIYLWEVASGVMYHSWDAHYRQITVLRFTHDSLGLISGSEDSGVTVWSVSRLLDEALQAELPTPYCTLSDHTLPITDLSIGFGSFPNLHILTSSLDHSVKLWDLSTRNMLTTFQFPQPITCLAFDKSERMFFAGSADGSIHQMNLFRQKSTGPVQFEAIGGLGTSDVIRADEDPKIQRKRLISVGQHVTCLTISLLSSLLLVGTGEGLVHVYDIASHQLLRTITTHKGFSITHLRTSLKPPDLVGHVSLELGLTSGSSADAREMIPVRPVSAFQRTRDPKTREAHEVNMILPVQQTVQNTDTFDYSEEDMSKDHAFFFSVQGTPAATNSTDPNVIQSRVTELEAEVALLREQLGRAKGVNDAIWEGVVQKVMGQHINTNGEGVRSPANKKARR